MTWADAAGAAGWLLITLGFFVARGRVALFSGVCATLIAALARLIWDLRAADGANVVALLAGLALYSVGLLIIRAMLVRSVSLHLLATCHDPSSAEAFERQIRARVDEADRYRLVHCTGDRLALRP